jgi:peptide-methionine (R)-S-oxide reductase
MSAAPTSKSESDWAARLTVEQFRVLRLHSTEHAGSGPLNAEARAGKFLCAGCATPLFDSTTKFERCSRWPSFYRPIEGAIGTTVDTSHGMRRVKVHCATCHGHFGHLFPDGPRPTGERYCVNGVALEFATA